MFSGKIIKMKAIEIISKTDKKGHLKINYPLNRPDSKVRILLLVEDEDEQDEEIRGLTSILNNPAFDFLAEEGENIYSLADGEPINV